MTPTSAIEHDLRQFLDVNFPLRNDDAGLGASDSLVEHGVIDSVGVLEMIDFLESRFEVEVFDDELLPENLDSIGSIVRYVSAKLERRHALVAV